MTNKQFKHKKTDQIFTKTSENTYTDGYSIIPNWVIENSEDWEEIEELCVPIGTFFKTVHGDTIYTISKIKNTKVLITWEKEDVLTCEYSIVEVNNFFVTELWKKYVLTTEDKVLIFEKEPYFYVIPNEPDKGVFYTNEQPEKELNAHIFGRSSNAFKFLDSISKKSLIKTSKGEDIYLGDYYFVVNTEKWDKPIQKMAEKDVKFSPYAKVFATRQEAEDFYLMNYPCLSIQDLLTYSSTSYDENVLSGQSKTWDQHLKELVKEKTNNL